MTDAEARNHEAAIDQAFDPGDLSGAEERADAYRRGANVTNVTTHPEPARDTAAISAACRPVSTLLDYPGYLNSFLVHSGPVTFRPALHSLRKRMKYMLEQSPHCEGM
jgi:hypothetical protein